MIFTVLFWLFVGIVGLVIAYYGFALLIMGYVIFSGRKVVRMSSEQMLREIEKKVGGKR